jgi:alpha-beta hydrolase superfamily lysophospholipase
VVICTPFGHEAICAHRSVRVFAAAAAAAGLPALRFDYAGTGDSGELHADADQIERWTQDVVAAAAELARRTGVRRVCLMGFRLGALLAVLAAARSSLVDSVALIAPVISGRSYVRELRIAQRVASLAAATRSAGIEARSQGGAAAADDLEAAGFRLSQATVASLMEIELAGRAVVPVKHALVIDRQELPAARAYSDTLAAANVRAEYCSLPGFTQAMGTSAELARVPQAMVDKARQWLHSLPRAQARDAALAPPTAAVAETLLLPPGQGRPALSERPVLFGSEAVLFGILTEPCQTEPRRRCVILLNMGADHHVGANRLYVLLARQWAALGYLVMRMDLAGLGDSETRRGRADAEVFPPAALDDIRAAIDLLRARHGADEITLAGVCSGAYHALRAAVAGAPVSRILMVNPLNYFWTEGGRLDALLDVEVTRDLKMDVQRLRSAAAWRRLLTGRVNVWRIFRGYGQRPWFTVKSGLRDLARRLHVPLAKDLGAELEQITARGVQVAFVFARGEPGLHRLELEGGSSVKKLGERCRVHIIDCGDHTFSRSADRAALEEVLGRELNAGRSLLRPR